VHNIKNEKRRITMKEAFKAAATVLAKAIASGVTANLRRRSHYHHF
jgi:hypothetical protein